jgi:hypothetical protein
MCNDNKVALTKHHYFSNRISGVKIYVYKNIYMYTSISPC